MAKSAKTYELEEIITLATARPNRVGCAEVTLDDYGIVDYVSMDLDGGKTVRCYELKISKSDFLSDAKKTFIGEYNYYVIPTELWTSVRGYVEPGIGVWVVDPRGHISVKKKASRKTCPMDKGRIMGKIMRALNRENLKHCEGAWRQRQVDKKVADRLGVALSIGDIVDYRGGQYEVVSIDYSQEQMELSARLTIRSVNRGKEELEDIRPSIVRRVMMDAVS